MRTEIDRWQEQIQKIKEALLEIGDMRPGALSQQYNVCGKAGCRCKDPKDPQKHGPYYQLSYTHEGKSTTEFVKKADVSAVRRQVQNYTKFRKLTDEWVALSLRIAKAKKNASR